MFKTHNSHHALMARPSSFKGYRLSERHADNRSYAPLDNSLFIVWDIIGGLLLGSTFFFTGFYLFQ